jgi:hypothetical protein
MESLSVSPESLEVRRDDRRRIAPDAAAASASGNEKLEAKARIRICRLMSNFEARNSAAAIPALRCEGTK